ncbi:MAG: HD domain-containing protein [Thermodesulfovibrionales bacterium]|nr:HD domain-containing protein [Thermodesulfovibrionales bacterium]
MEPRLTKKTSEHGSFSRLALYVSLLGWGVLGLYALSVYTFAYEEFTRHLAEFWSPEYTGFRVRALILFAPFISTVLGYLVNEKAKLIKERLRNDETIEKAIGQWRATFDCLPYGMMIIDPDCNILRANDYIARLYGVPHVKELINKKCSDIVHKKDGRPDACPMKKSLQTLETETLEYHDQSLGRWFLLSTAPTVSDSGMTFVHSIIDITEIKEKERKLAEGKAAFYNMLKDLDVSYKELKSLYDGLIFAFASALDAKSPWTKGHSERVTAYAVSIAEEMGLSEKDIETLRTAALLHDIGKIGTYDVILDKPGRLTDEEFALVMQHPAKGAEFLKHIDQMSKVIPIIRHHHERMDGSGYPDRLNSGDIPLMARILCIADSFDSMTADRPYRPSPGKDYAVSEIKRCSGTQFDPEVAAAFLRLLEGQKALSGSL